MDRAAGSALDGRPGPVAGGAARLLVDATIASIHRNGLCDTSVATVTEIAGLSRGMVRHVFLSKSAMLVAAYESLSAEWIATLEADRPGPARARLEAMVAASFAPPSFDPPKLSAWLAFSVAAQSDEALREVNRAAYAACRTAFVAELERHAAETGAEIAPQRIAMTLLALADGLWLQHILEPERMTGDLIADLCHDALAALIGPGPAAALPERDDRR